MNTSINERPRFACRVTRAWVSIVRGGDAGRSGHVEQCEDCQCYFAADDALTQTLKRDAVRQRVEPSANLERDILRAVREAAAPVPEHARPAQFATWGLIGGIAGVAAAVAFVVLAPSRISTSERGVAVEVDRESLKAVGSVVSDLWKSVAPASETLLNGQTLLAADPLQKEVDAVYFEARSAVAFLAMNFLPIDKATAMESLQPAQRAAGG